MFGLMALWPFMVLVWIMAVMVYLTTKSSPTLDFLFEFFNSLQVSDLFFSQSKEEIIVVLFRVC